MLCVAALQQDAVARSAKFWVFYKRAGQRVLINDRGDMLVRPTFTELSIQQSPMGSSVFHVSPHPLSACVVLALPFPAALPAGRCTAEAGNFVSELARVRHQLQECPVMFLRELQIT